MTAASDPGKKRRISDSPQHAEGKVKGKLLLDRLWFQVACAAANSLDFPPSPGIEVARRREVIRLRGLYEELVRKVSPSISAPRESFNRWLLGRLNGPAGRAPGADPLLGGDGSFSHSGDASACDVLLGELLSALPVALPYFNYTDAGGQYANLGRYATEMLPLLQDSHQDTEVQKACHAALNSVLTRAEKARSDQSDNESGSGLAEYPGVASVALEKLAELRRICTPVIRARFESSLREVCSKLEHAAAEAAMAVHTLRSERPACLATTVSPAFDVHRHVYLFSIKRSEDDVQEASKSAELMCASGNRRTREHDQGSSAESSDEQQSNIASCEAEAFVIGAEHFQNLSKAFRRSGRLANKIFAASHGAEEVSTEVAAVAPHVVSTLSRFFMASESIWDLVFCTLCRYNALCGPGPKEGGGFHAAVPPVVFDALAEAAGGVGVESFASPLLCRGAGWRYCSVFNDLDVFFGSLGSFLGEGLLPELVGGTFEVNPPFIPAVVVQMVEKIIAALDRAEATGTSLQFVVVLPGISPASLEDRPERAPASIRRLLESRYTQATTSRHRRRFAYGLSFKTDKQWPPFAVPAQLVLLQTSAAAAAASPSCILRSIGGVWESLSESDE